MNMRTILAATVSIVALMAIAGPGVAQEVTSSASVLVTVTVTKDKDITVTETITKNKTIDIIVDASPLDTQGAAEADVVAEQENINVTVTGAIDEVTGLDQGVQRDATIDASINSNAGIVGVNQDVGDFANQANIVAFAFVNNTTGLTSVANSQAHVSQHNENSVTTDVEEFDITANRRAASITGSIIGNTGIVGVNQNAGNMNNQINAVALAVGVNAAVALSEADLGQLNSSVEVNETNTTRAEDITGSVVGNTGITQVNQSNGNLNNQASVVSVSALTSSVAIGGPAVGAPSAAP
jgi:hypothetical protein